MEIVKKPVLFEDKFSIEVTLDDGTVHNIGRFSDDKKAIEAVKEFEEREFGKPKMSYKSKNPFDFMNGFYRKVNLFDGMNAGEFHVNNKGYTQFIINRGLSMSQENARMINAIGHMNLPNYVHAAYCSQAARKPARFNKWAKESAKDKKKEEKIKEIMKELIINRDRAEEAYEILCLIGNKKQ